MSKAKIINVFTQKGGSGKTTTAVNLAYELGKEGRTLLVDIDTQGSATTWVSNCPDDTPFPAVVTQLDKMGKKLIGELKKQIDLYDYIVIDTPPSTEQEGSRVAMLISDIVVVPVDPAPLDFWAAEMALQLINDARVTNDELIALFVRTKEDASTNVAKVIRQNIDELIEEEPNTHHADTSLSFLVSYKEAPLYGIGVTDIPKANPKAVQEVKNLVKEIKKHLGGY
jgi:chromosome partitioning protein